MSFFIHTVFMTSFVGMILHFWRQLPLVEGESPSGRIREFIEWSGKGVGAPLAVWLFMNLGLATWLPPFLPEVDVAKNAGGFWPWAVLLYCSPAMSVIVSYWAALSLILLALTIRSRTEDPAGFNVTLITWGCFLLPVGAIALWLAGWAGAGFALVLWLAPVVHGTLANMVTVPRAPSYSQAIAKIKFGKYSEAELEVIKELEQCENDFNGWMMLAELYAVHFHDFKQAEQTVIDLCEQPGITPSDACVALHRLADWHLQLQNDPRGARRCMEAIIRRYPKSHLDRMARLRLNRIPHTAEEWIEECRGKPLHLPALHDEFEEPEEEAVDVHDVERRAVMYSQKLARDPNDTQTREEFARALAKLNKLEAAVEQMELLLAMEGQMTTHRAEWMGLKAAWMLQVNPESPEVREVLRRIIQEFPLSPQAMAAQRRIFLLDERLRVAKYAARPKKPRIVIRLTDPAGAPGISGNNNGKTTGPK